MRNNKGMTYIELMVVMAIVLTLIIGGTSATMRIRNMNTVRAGISRVFQLKNAVDIMAKECGGYPDREPALIKDYASLEPIINRCGAGSPNCKAPYPNGLPSVFPSGRECDAVSLQNSIASGLSFPTCDLSDAACAGKIRANAHKQFNSMFVDGLDCSVSDGKHATGWNYALSHKPADYTARPVAIVCANILYNPGKTNGTVTVTLNSAGISQSGIQANNNSGMVSIKGDGLPNACPCGAHCTDNVTGKSGCCQSCTDSTNGQRHEGIGFNYR
jgi:type II secretory pathway pseudopilin PulG